MTTAGRMAIAAVALCATASSAQAQEEGLARARDAFNKAQTLFEAKNYSEAATWFQKAYEARPFPEFLFNIAASYERMEKWDKAVKYYKKYLNNSKTPNDAANLRKRVAVLEREAKRIADAKNNPPKPDPASPGAPAKPTEPPKPSEEVKNLAKVKVRGLLVIESDPGGATIYLDGNRAKAFSRTPWRGQLKPGEHIIDIERRGYKPIEGKSLTFLPERFSYYYFALAEADYLGLVEFTSSIPGADVYIDDKAAGVRFQTPKRIELPPGKHKVWVVKEGYKEVYKQITVIQAQSQKVSFEMKGAPVGYVHVRGPGIELTRVYMDGEVLCERGPCRKAVPEGRHRLKFKRNGYKDYTRTVVVQPQTETTVYTTLSSEPSRTDAITAYLLSAAFLGAGLYAGNEHQKVLDELEADITTGVPPVSSADERLGYTPFKGGKFWAIAADTGYGLSAVTFLTAVYFTFRDKGPPSTGRSDVKSIAVSPTLGRGFAGAAMEVSF